MCNCGEFNISSHRQVGEILFDILKIGKGKKIKSGYSTNVATLSKYRDKHPVVDKIIEYRTLAKLHSTYIEGLKNCIMEDGKIHTIYTQTLTRTGRLSSIEPNLQNIPIRYEEGRLIRKSFVPSNNCMFLSSDYSQIERGSRYMTFEQCIKIAKALETSMDYLAGLTDEETPYPRSK